jgi:hypothetical protein
MVLELHNSSRRNAVVRDVTDLEGKAATKDFGVEHAVDDGAVVGGDERGLVVFACQGGTDDPVPDGVGTVVYEFYGVGGEGGGEEGKEAKKEDKYGTLHFKCKKKGGAMLKGG